MFEERGRLFGISMRGFIFELDMSMLTIKNVRDTYGGAAWCMASSVRDATIAVGAEDGAAHLFDYSNNRLEYIRGLPNVGSRILSIAYHPVKSQLFLGLADGTIRCVDEKNGTSFFRMTGDVFRGLATHIWSMVVLTDSTVVTGDGRGNVQIWDGTVGVLMLNIHQNTAEILALAVTPDERQIFASGVDGRVTCIKKVTQVSSNDKSTDDAGNVDNVNANPADSQWVYTSSHRPHSHDVYALTICMNTSSNSSASRVRSNSESDNNSNNSNNDSDNGTRKRSGSFSLQNNPNPNTQKPLDIDGYVLLSGGMDTKLCCYSVSDFVRIRPTWILPMPATGIIHYSQPEYNLIAIKHRNRIDLWDAKLLLNDDSETNSIGDNRCQVFLKMEMSTPDHIHSFCLAPNGKFIAVSSAAGTRIWRIDRSDSGHARITKLVLSDYSLSFCHCMSFSPDSNRLAAYTSKGLLLLLDLSSCNLNSTSTKKKKKNIDQEDTPNETLHTVKVWHVFNHKHELIEKNKKMKTKETELGLGLGLGLQEVGLSVIFSPDNLYVALSDAMGGVTVYEIDRLRLHWHVPNPTSTPSPVTAISFHPTSPTSLLVTLANNTFMIFDVEQLNLTQWSIDNNDKVSSILRYKSITIFHYV